MEDEIAAFGQQAGVTAKGLTHAALDAVAFMRFSDNFAGCEADARAGKVLICLRLLRGKEPAHRSGLAFATSCVGALIVGVLGEARTGQ
jgi:hypothetical protein